jgi:hypothetical protein
MRKLTNEEYIQKAKDKHGDKYNYSKTIYEKHFKKANVL